MRVLTGPVILIVQCVGWSNVTNWPPLTGRARESAMPRLRLRQGLSSMREHS